MVYDYILEAREDLQLETSEEEAREIHTIMLEISEILRFLTVSNIQNTHDLLLYYFVCVKFI